MKPFSFFLILLTFQLSYAKDISDLPIKKTQALKLNHSLLNTIDGCTDENACNFNLLATNDDGSCAYNSSSVDFQTACDSLTWIDGILYTESIDGVPYNITNENGCDSSITLFLTIIESTPSISSSVSACESYNWQGVNYDSSGTYIYYSSYNEGCGIETLELEILDISEGIDVQEHCGEFTWIDDIVYTESNNSAIYTITNENGCDSIITLNLTILDTSLNVTTTSACNSYVWKDSTYFESGVYDQILTNSLGCDSTNRLALEINTPTYALDFQTHCNPFTWIDGITYSENNDSAMYTLTNSKGCDSIISLNLNIDDNYSTSFDTITACGNYTWNGFTYTESGNYENVSFNGCDSSALNLTIKASYSTIDYQQHCDSYTWNNGITYTENNNNAVYFYTAQNGCDSTITLNLEILNSSLLNISAMACESYVWNDSTYTESGTYEQLITNSNGCDSTILLNLTIKDISYSIDAQTHCGEYTWIDGITYYENNDNATYTLSDSFGCDSIVTLILEINQPEIVYDTISACDSYSIGNITYDSSGVYSILNTNNDSCQTTLLDLTIYKSLDTTINITTCQPYVWYDSTYTQSGTYFYNNTTPLGCDSSITLALTINNGSVSNSNEVACNSFFWNDSTYTESGTYTYSTTNLLGCDSIATLDLTINNNSTSTSTVTACDSFFWNDSTYFQSGIYSYNLVNTNGCDSTISIDLSINVSQNITNYISISEGEAYSVANQTYNTSGTYTDSLQTIFSCDSIITTILTVIPKTFNCNIDDFGCTNPGDGSGYFSSIEACIENCVTSIQENENIDFVIFPNPFSNETNILLQNPNEENLTINLIDLRGRILRNFKNTNSNRITIKKESLAEGIYFIQLLGENYINQKTLIIE